MGLPMNGEDKFCYRMNIDLSLGGFSICIMQMTHTHTQLIVFLKDLNTIYKGIQVILSSRKVFPTLWLSGVQHFFLKKKTCRWKHL